MTTPINKQDIIPDEHLNVTSMILSLPQRPQPTGGSLGTRERLYTNHFSCSFDTNLVLHQYDVSIEEVGFSSGNWFEVKVRARCAAIMQLLISSGRFDPQVIVWYDEQKCLYSTSRLPTPHTIVSEDGRSRLNINSLANQWSTNDIHDYLDGRTNMYPYDAVRILETLLKKSIQGPVQVVNNICYVRDKSPTILSGGFEMREGFIQALDLSSERLTLNVRIKLTTFYPEISLLDFISMEIGQNRMPSGKDYNKLSQILEHCQVVTQQSGWTQTYTINRFDRRRPPEIRIQTGESLVEYYKNIKNIELQHTDFRCVQVYLLNNSRKPCHLPVELCRIKTWQVYKKQTFHTQEAQQSPNHTPKGRFEAIMDNLNRCNYNSDENRLCREVGFHIDDSKMLTLDARVLKQPEIETGPNHQVNIRVGRIPLNGHLFTPKSISTLAIVYFGTDYPTKKRTIKRFRETLLNVMKIHQIDVIEEIHSELRSVQSDLDSINQYFCSMIEQNCQLVVCIMDGRLKGDLAQLKAWIKECGTIKHGIMTQCVLLSNIIHSRSIWSYCESLLRKINFKNAGINTKVNLDVVLKNKKFESESFMFFGATVIHTSNVTRQHPSIATIVGSGDSLCSTTAVRVCQQYPKEGKCSMEIIVGMTEMVEQLLEYNREANQRLPDKVIFYRDGIDDGQFGKVIEYEIPAIRKAFDTIYGVESSQPLLTFIVVKKRHNTRFFTFNQVTGEINNMSIGSVIDTTIVHPYQCNFYLNSYKAHQGVNRPSLYYVLLDEIGFTADELQLLTYHLCFTDPRSSTVEAIPSVLHQADLAVLKARNLFYDDGGSSKMSNGGRNQLLQNTTMNGLTYRILDVHESLTNRPVFS